MKSLFDDEIANEMARLLNKQASEEEVDLVKAGEYLHSAMDILEQQGFQKNAEDVLNILYKIAVKHKKKVDKHTKGLTSEKMVKNLLDHGTEFNLADQNLSLDLDDDDDLLNLEFDENNIEVDETDPLSLDFEDEI